MKVIFLDVDGVLNTSKTTRRLNCCDEFTFVDTRKVLRLREIVERSLQNADNAQFTRTSADDGI